MCLITEQKKAIRTKEDMIVWKVMNDGGQAAYRDFVYKEGELYKSKIKQDYSNVNWADNEAFETYSLVSSLVHRHDGNVEAWRMSGFVVIGQGFHSCETKIRAEAMSKHSFEVIRSFLIPAGSLIYKDKTGLIVSNQIMMLPEKNH